MTHVSATTVSSHAPEAAEWLPDQPLMPAWLEETFSWMASFTLHLASLLLILALFYFGAKAITDPRTINEPPPVGDPGVTGEGFGGTPNPGLADLPTPAIQNLFPDSTTKGWAQTKSDLKLSSYLQGSPGELAGFIALGTGGSSGSGTGGPGAGQGGPLAMFGPTPNRGGQPDFFGITGDPHRPDYPPGGRTASRIVYILDHSGSMLDSFDFLRQEVKRSVGKLLPSQRFAVVMFSETVDCVYARGGSQLQPATPDAKQQLDGWMDNVKAQGVNDDLLEPFVQAFQKAFAMSPPPQVVYFLTDGNHDPRLVERVREMNARSKVRIHTIAFVRITREAEENLRTIASEHKGKYKFVAEKDLGNQ